MDGWIGGYVAKLEAMKVGTMYVDAKTSPQKPLTLFSKILISVFVSHLTQSDILSLISHFSLLMFYYYYYTF